LQTHQRICEWRSAFGSAALAIVNAFFDNNDEFKTDQAHVDFAENQLRHFAFLYSSSTGDDSSVCALSDCFILINE
jgi:hypothetical protein